MSFLPITLDLYYSCPTRLGDELLAVAANSRTRWLGVNRVPVFVSRFRTSAANVYVTFDLVAWRPAFNDIIRLYWTPWSFRPTWKINVSTRPTHRTRVHQRRMSQLTSLQRVSASRLLTNFSRPFASGNPRRSFTNSHPFNVFFAANYRWLFYRG